MSLDTLLISVSVSPLRSTQPASSLCRLLSGAYPLGHGTWHWTRTSEKAALGTRWLWFWQFLSFQECLHHSSLPSELSLSSSNVTLFTNIPFRNYSLPSLSTAEHLFLCAVSILLPPIVDFLHVWHSNLVSILLNSVYSTHFMFNLYFLNLNFLWIWSPIVHKFTEMFNYEKP